MGFRSTCIGSSRWTRWPDWFIDKYQTMFYLDTDDVAPLASRGEYKCYAGYAELHIDIQKAITWTKTDEDVPYIFVFLHECGGITRCEITSKDIKWSEPLSWARTGGVLHDYCHNCSSAPDDMASTTNTPAGLRPEEIK